MSFTAFFQNKAVTLMGLGLLGRGVGDAAFLAEHCAKVYVTDAKPTEALAPSVEALKKYPNIEFILGGHDFKNFENVDFIIKGAGVRLDNPYILHAQKNHVPVYMSTALFAKFAGIPILGVTGTRGKTTTTCMVESILRAAGKKVLLGGNIRGVSTLAQLPEAGEYDIAVLELDSWQLQGFDSLQISPNIAVFTSFYPDHMNYYDNDEARYLYDKATIFRHQKPGDVFVCSTQVEPLLTAQKAEHKGQWRTAPTLPESLTLQLAGNHNRDNAAVAAEAARACNVPEATIAAVLQSFQAVEGRLQNVGTKQGRTFYNDNNATTQEATLAALKSFPADKTVLIFGGADKGLPVDALVGYISRNNIRAVLLGGTGTDLIRDQLPATPVATSMPEAFAEALKQSNQGDIILLSPGFASFGLFKNEYDRNDQFMAQLAQLS